VRAAVCLGLLVASVVASNADAARYGAFQTPSRNIVCDFSIGGAATSFVRCGIRSGLVGAPLLHCTVDDPNATFVTLGRTGRGSRVPCLGDPGPFVYPHAPVLRYGSTWSGNGMSCASERTGLTCRNRGGHGFFLSRLRWRVF